MDKRFKIVVVPYDLDLSKDPTYEESLFGAAFADTKKLVVNQVEDGYSILYKDRDFVKLDMQMIARQLIESIERNFPDEEIEINVYYFFAENVWERCGECVCKLDNIFDEYNDSVDGNITYERTRFIDDLYDKLGYEDAPEEDDEDVTMYEDEVCSPDDVVDTLRRMTGYRESSPFNDDDDDDYPRPRKKVVKKSYGTSSVLKSTKKVKKVIRRHNIIISSDKEAKKRDKKIIRKMVRDFIKPGNSRLLRDFCDDLTDRWFNEFVISKKVARKLAKAHKKEIKEKSSSGKDNRVNNSIARSILQRVDPFYDSNK